MKDSAPVILVVEDDELNLMIARHILGKGGYEVETAGDGEEAVQKAGARRFDLILMDIEMPVMDGLEALSLIRQLPGGADMPIIALTAHNIPEKLEEFLAAGMDGYLIKPFDEVQFAKIAEKYLAA
ncbi:MAG: response regulator [Bacteroidetes bacterium]|nr:MAG: response regulator [Bacteroidota bacterium]